MRLDITIAYAPTLTLEARRLLPSGMTLRLGTKMTVEVPELANEDAPVAFTFRERDRSWEWRCRGNVWLLPLGTEAGLTALEVPPRHLDARSFEGLVSAGYRPARDSTTGLACLVPDDSVQAVAAGAALYAMIERQNPSSPAQWRNRNIIDSGDLRRREAEARCAWGSLGAVIIDGKAWHAASEPVLVVHRDGRVAVLPSRSGIAEWNAREGRTYPLSEWEKALEASEAEAGRRPGCLLEWAEEPSKSPAP